ncbi:MAG: STM4013/SEN3800 family hydrolase [Gallionellaceae bacterium]
MLPKMRDLVGKANILFITLDTLRYDVALSEFQAGNTPNLAAVMPLGWEKCHSPASFTFAAHCAFFAGFLPTPARPGCHERLFALKFAGSKTVGAGTFVFDNQDIVSGFAQQGYRTICIGGVGFFKKQNPLSCQLPALFQESYWEERFGVGCPDSTRHQVDFACRLLTGQTPVFMFLNVSALHQPNCCYLPGSTTDSITTHAAALRYVDTQLGTLFDAFRQRGDTLIILTSDHGTCYGEDGYSGHRIGHEQVWTVPFAANYFKKNEL